MWMRVSGALLPNRGAMFPALKSTGLSDAAIRRAWVAFRKGAWQIALLLRLWQEYVMGLEGWQEHRYEGYVPVTVDVTAFWRPALKRCGLCGIYGRAGILCPPILCLPIPCLPVLCLLCPNSCPNLSAFS